MYIDKTQKYKKMEIDSEKSSRKQREKRWFLSIDL